MVLVTGGTVAVPFTPVRSYMPNMRLTVVVGKSVVSSALPVPKVTMIPPSGGKPNAGEVVIGKATPLELLAVKNGIPAP